MEINKTVSLILFLALLAIVFYIIKPFISAIIFAAVLAYLLYPVYKRMIKKLNKNVAAAILTIIPILIIFAFVWFSSSIVITQAFNFYREIQRLDLINFTEGIIKNVFKFEPEMARQVTVTIQQGLTEISTTIVKKAGEIITNIPRLLVQAFVMFFVLFFILRDSEKIITNLKNALPFEKKINKTITARTNQITRSIIYGRFIVGTIQGIVAGIGFYIFKVEHAFLFTLAAIFFAILPFVGPWLIWLPASINFIIANQIDKGIGLFIYGSIVVSLIDNFLGPIIVGRKARVNSGVILIGMLGGLYTFGATGLIIGPLLLEYLMMGFLTYQQIIKEKNKKKGKKK